MDQTVELATGHEWDFPRQFLYPNFNYEIAWVGTVRAYVGLWREADHNAFRARGTAAPFPFASDRYSSARIVRLPAQDWYHLVARIGVFTPPGRVRVGLYRL